MPEPIVGIYPFADPGVDIVLFEGDVRVGDVHEAGRIWLNMTGDLGFRWELNEGAWLGEPGETEVSFKHPVYGDVTLPAVMRSSGGSGDLTGSEIGAENAIDALVIHWMNMPAITRGEGLELPGKQWSGTWRLEASGWEMTMDAPIEHSALFEAAKDRCTHVMTHVARLQRADGSVFTLAEATEVVAAWQVALSFAVGRWVAPSLAVGFRSDARLAEQWQPWRCFSPATPQAWWDQHRTEDLSEFTTRFVEAWLDPDRHAVVRHFAFHVIEGNTVGTLEARIMLLGAGMEYLSWVRHVVEGGRRAREHKDLPAADKLRELLAEADIPALEPAELAALAQLIAEKSGEPHPLEDGPGAIAWVRNRLVHPKDAAEPYRITRLLFEIWSLQLGYADLMLLHLVGYAGELRKRFPPGRWAHTTEPVPWAATVRVIAPEQPD